MEIKKLPAAYPRGYVPQGCPLYEALVNLNMPVTGSYGLTQKKSPNTNSQGGKK